MDHDISNTLLQLTEVTRPWVFKSEISTNPFTGFFSKSISLIRTCDPSRNKMHKMVQLFGIFMKNFSESQGLHSIRTKSVVKNFTEPASRISSARSQFEAAMNLPWNGKDLVSPSLWNCLVWSTRNNLTCMSGRVSVISSRRIVPYCPQVSRYPLRSCNAPVKSLCGVRTTRTPIMSQ